MDTPDLVVYANFILFSLWKAILFLIKQS